MKENFEKQYKRKKSIKILSLDNKQDLKIIEKQLYQDYLREQASQNERRWSR